MRPQPHSDPGGGAVEPPSLARRVREGTRPRRVQRRLELASTSLRPMAEGEVIPGGVHDGRRAIRCQRHQNGQYTRDGMVNSARLSTKRRASGRNRIAAPGPDSVDRLLDASALAGTHYGSVFPLAQAVHTLDVLLYFVCQRLPRKYGTEGWYSKTKNPH